MTWENNPRQGRLVCLGKDYFCIFVLADNLFND